MALASLWRRYRAWCCDLRVESLYLSVYEDEIVRRISRRGFLYSSVGASIAMRPWFAKAKQTGGPELLLIGTKTAETSKGIYAYALDSATGDLKQIGLAAEVDNPTFLVLGPDGKTVFVANEVDQYEGKNSGAISSYSLDRRNATLTKINEVATGGAGTCHVAVDHTGRAAFAANYAGGSAASFRVGADGRLSPAVWVAQYHGHGPNKERQEMPHAHRVTVSPDNRFLLVNDLGLDEIHIYRLDAATAEVTRNDPPAWKSAPGAGPRALRFHPNGRWAYCVTEMGSTIDILRWHPERGALETVQVLPMASRSFHGVTGGADIIIDQGARFAYATDRFDDIVVTFSISPQDGKLTLLNQTPCGGRIPRHLALDPSGRWLLAANQESDNIAVFSRNLQSGALSPGKSFPISKPQCLVFA